MGAGHDSRWRAATTVICLVLAGLLTAPAVVGFWGQRTLNDTERYVDTVQPLVDSPEVQDAVASTVVAAIEQRLDIESLLDDVFSGVIEDRPRLQRLTGLLAGAANAQIERVTREFVASPTFAEIWVRTNTRAQQSLQRVLHGEPSGAVSMEGDQIVLDVDEVIDQVSQRLIDRGVPLLSRVDIPATDRQIVLIEAPAVQDLRTIYAFGNPIATWLLPLVGLIYLAAFLLTRRRARTTVVIGALLIANALLLSLALSIGRQLFVNHLSGTAFGPASRVFYDTLLTYLVRGHQVLLVVGLLLVAAGWLAGVSRTGTAVRGAAAQGLEGVGARVAGAAGGGPVARTGRWVAPNAAWLRWVILALGVVALFWGNEPSLPRLWWCLGLVLLLLGALQVLAGVGRSPHATRTPPEAVDPAH